MNIQGKYIKYEDYVALEERCAALSADNDKAMEAMKQANEVVKIAHSKYSKLAAENAALKSALNDILQPDAAVLERNHRVCALDAMATPATEAHLAEVRAQGVDEIAELYFTLAAHEANRSIADSWRESARFARDHAAQLRKGVQS
ncbi:hypothetical protein VQ366_004292 [Salmonella enterica]|nr:hypothetical protein [Salmonella enterica]EHK1238303.1 hypothetical protein [Salmonella enterica]EHN5989343.1 hypothetical protein [Salmonella enterica]EJJ4071317.1 hypothetical protein [Salmonella enterica]EJJ4153933.1 hypothetical protein [Salmonella enterica]